MRVKDCLCCAVLCCAVLGRDTVGIRWMGLCMQDTVVDRCMQDTFVGR